MLDGASLRIRGEHVDKLIRYSLDSDFITPTDGFEATVYSDDFEAMYQQTVCVQPVEFYVNGNLQFLGRIDSQTINDDGTIDIACRDYLATITDGRVDPVVKLKEGQSLDSALKSIIKPAGITEIQDGWNATRNALTGVNVFSGSPEKDFKKATVSDTKAAPNQGMWELCDQLLARHGFTIQPTMQRHAIALCRPEYRQDPLYELKRVRGASQATNILSGRVTRDWGQVPTVTIASGRSGRAAGEIQSMRWEVSTFGPEAVNPIGESSDALDILRKTNVLFFRFAPTNDGVPDNNGLVYKPLFVDDKESKNREELENKVKREMASRLRNTLQVSYMVAGHSDPQTGAIYTVDTMARVFDNVAKIDEPLWVSGRRFTYTPQQGAMTELRLWRPTTFIL